MKEERVTVEITRQAADCLASFIDHDMYGDGDKDLSKIIIIHFREWQCREHRDSDEELNYVKGEYKRHFNA